MAEYIDIDRLRDWLKTIPLRDLSDGAGLCRVIFEVDFAKAVRSLPEYAIADVVAVVRCKDCKYMETVYDEPWCYRTGNFLGGTDGYCAWAKVGEE